MHSHAIAHIRDDDVCSPNRNRSSFAGCAGQIVAQKSCHCSSSHFGMSDDAPTVAMLCDCHRVALDRSAATVTPEYRSNAIVRS